MTIEAVEVVPHLWQGPHPNPEDEGILRWDLVVGAAEEAMQPIYKVNWLYLPLRDSDEEYQNVRMMIIVRRTAAFMSDLLEDGADVFVFCGAGLNRSGLIVARTLMFRGFSPVESIQEVRRARGPMALSNGGFVTWLMAEGGMAASETLLSEILTQE
jgi:hypothetical protein